MARPKPAEPTMPNALGPSLTECVLLNEGSQESPLVANDSLYCILILFNASCSGFCGHSHCAQHALIARSTYVFLLRVLLVLLM